MIIEACQPHVLDEKYNYHFHFQMKLSKWRYLILDAAYGMVELNKWKCLYHLESTEAPLNQI